MSSAREPRARFYDGGVYAAFMDRLHAGLNGFVADQVEPGQRVLDAGCGTGDLALRLAPRAAQVVGIELSPAMHRFAERRLAARPLTNVSFVLGDMTRALSGHAEGSFDLAIIVLVLHELPGETRTPALQELSRVAREVLCVDFRASMPWNPAGIRNRLLEMIAGPTHFRAFRDFVRCGGASGVAASAGLRHRHLRYIDAETLEVGFISR